MPHDKEVFKRIRDEALKEIQGFELPQKDKILQVLQEYEDSHKVFGDSQREYFKFMCKGAKKEEREARQAEMVKLEKEDAARVDKLLEEILPILESLNLTESESFEATVMKCAMIRHESPKAIAKSCKKHGNNSVMELFDSTDIQREFWTNGGPFGGNWCRAYRLYKQLKPLVRQDDEYTACHERLAMAVALEHATPIELRLEKEVFVDPIARFQHFADAHRNGELDPAFGYFTTWEYRLIVDSKAPDDQLQWGRDYLKNYRPDQACWHNPQRRYSNSVDTDMKYGPLNREGRLTYQRLLSEPGQCGPYAWFTRFINKAHGIPTWGVQQPGHATLTKWSGKHGWTVGPSSPGCGWLQCLGYHGKQHAGAAFRLEASARSFQYGKEDEIFRKYSFLMCMAQALSEDIDTSRKLYESPFSPKYLWCSLANAQLHAWGKQAESKHFERGPAYKEPDETFPCCHQETAARTDKVVDYPIFATSDDGKIKLNPAHFQKDANSLKLRSYLGGWQAHLKGKDAFLKRALPKDFPSNDYELSCRVCTVHSAHEKEFLCIHVNDNVEIKVSVPYTLGEWVRTQKVQVTLREGDTLKLTRSGEQCKGLSLKEIILTPF